MRLAHIHPHAQARMAGRGVTPEEARAAVACWEHLEMREGRFVFRKNFPFCGPRRAVRYFRKEVEVLAVQDAERLVAVSVTVKYY